MTKSTCLLRRLIGASWANRRLAQRRPIVSGGDSADIDQALYHRPVECALEVVNRIVIGKACVYNVNGIPAQIDLDNIRPFAADSTEEEACHVPVACSEFEFPPPLPDTRHFLEDSPTRRSTSWLTRFEGRRAFSWTSTASRKKS